MAQQTPTSTRRAAFLSGLPRPSDFVRAERAVPPRLLPLWIIALIALVGHMPASVEWTYTASGLLVLGLALAPLVGSIRPTPVACLWLLAAIAGATAVTVWLPLGAAWDKAWLDHAPSGLLAIMLLGAVMVGALTSLVWAAVVLAEAGRRLVLRARRIPVARAEPAVPVSVEPASALRARRIATALRRAYIGLVSVCIAIPLPSFFELSGIHAARLRAPHDGVGDAVAGAVAATVWPTLALGWLALGAGIGWLVWLRSDRVWRKAGIVGGAVAVAIVLLTSADFGIVPGASGAQDFGAELLAVCPGNVRRACPPPWLFDAPALADATSTASAWAATLLLVATAALALRWRLRRRGGAGRA